MNYSTVPEPLRRKFSLGILHITANADQALAPLDVSLAIGRHSRGDWGDLNPDDCAANDAALQKGARLFSAYYDRKGVKFWIITEADRRLTTVLLPEDY